MKFLFGLLTLTAFAFALFLLAGSTANRVQIEAGPVVAPGGTPDPVRDGAPTPPGFRQLLPRDAILPVYNPTFVAPNGVDWPDDTLVIGLELDGEAKAYPVSFLNRREMVIDWIAGSPVLVTW